MPLSSNAQKQLDYLNQLVGVGGLADRTAGLLHGLNPDDPNYESDVDKLYQKTVHSGNGGENPDFILSNGKSTSYTSTPAGVTPNPTSSNTPPSGNSDPGGQTTNNNNSTPSGTAQNSNPSSSTSSPSQPQPTGTGSSYYDNSNQATADSSGNPTSPNVAPAYTSTVTGCSNFQILDKRIKLLRTHDKVLWFFWVDSLVGSGSGNSTGTNLKFTVTDAVTQKAIKTDVLDTEDSVLFYTRTLNENFSLPQDKQGNLNKNVLWCLWYDNPSNLYKPIHGAKYFDFWYDNDTHTLDLVFWANINIDDIGVSGKDPYDSIRSPYLNSGGELDPKSQRVVFHTKGTYSTVYSSRTQTGTKMDLTGMFLFNKPQLLLVPGQKSGSQADSVIDEAPSLTFLEFTA